MAPLGNLVTIVVPFYNEEEAVGAFYEALCAVLDGIADKSFEVICVMMAAPTTPCKSCSRSSIAMRASG